jgi:hypothetical protein
MYEPKQKYLKGQREDRRESIFLKKGSENFGGNRVTFLILRTPINVSPTIFSTLKPLLSKSRLYQKGDL